MDRMRGYTSKRGRISIRRKAWSIQGVVVVILDEGQHRMVVSGLMPSPTCAASDIS